MFQVLIILAGLALVFLTEHDTFGIVVTSVGLALLVLPFLLFGIGFTLFRRAMNDDDFLTTTHGRTIKRTRRQ